MAVEIADFIQDLRTQRQTVFVAILGLLVGVGVVFILGLPSWRKQLEIRKEITKTQQLLKTSEARRQAITSIDGEDIERLDLALPLSRQPFALLGVVETMARSAGVSIGDISINPGIISTDSARTTTNRNGQSTLPIKLSASGTITDITALVQTLEGSLPLLTIRSMALSPTRGTEEYRLELDILTYNAAFSASDFSKQTAKPLTKDQLATLENLRTRKVYELKDAPSVPSNFNNQNLFLNLGE